tara:strand:- start:1337 stop:1756 length:420 start_codon:yes stop_codon:yes gene_type:complete
VNNLTDWLAHNQPLLVGVGAGSAVIFVVSLLSLPWLVAKIPEDYFLPKKRQPSQWKIQRPLLGLLALVGKNLFGYGLILAGVLMLFLPGQGILTMVTGLLLIDYPGKFRVERRIVRIPTVLNGLNWLRAKAKKPPLIIG